MSDRATILDIRDLQVEIRQHLGTVYAVNGVSLTVREGETIGIVGESGCGKSMTAYSVMSLLPERGVIAGGSIRLWNKDGVAQEITKLDPESPAIRAMRGNDVAMIYQEPTAVFSPVHTFLDQVGEAYLVHNEADRREIERLVVAMFRTVGIPDAGRRVREYPFRFSGGMNQRAMIAMALICNPRLLIADEPTTALDVTTQAQILRLLRRLRAERGLAMVLITHNLGVVAHMADRVYVMYAGRIMEEASARELFARPAHPYTKALLRAVPRLTGDGTQLDAISGAVPDGRALPRGCVFHPRCPVFAGDRCTAAVPELVEISPGHRVACVLHGGKE
jgi:oligopeptide/dipeptide ABC transporter ATP-binding protein